MAPASIPTPIPTGSPASGRRALRILYADDLKELRELLQIVLSREGHTVETVADGSDAMERLREQKGGYDLLITDHHMPLMNGLQLVEAARALGFAGKIMVFSSELSPRVHQQYRQFGVDCIVHKPVFPAALRSTLAELFPSVSS